MRLGNGALSAWSAAIFAALGLSPFAACGATVADPSCKPSRPAKDHPGYESCEGHGSIHRPTQIDCVDRLPRPEQIFPDDPNRPYGCHSDADCTLLPHGYCTTEEAVPGSVCDYRCVRDADCKAGQICLCGPDIGQCVPAHCTDDTSCSPGAACVSFAFDPGCPMPAFACLRPGDTCVGDLDCKPPNPYCSIDRMTGLRSCHPLGCIVGRPFLVGGAARVAPLRDGARFRSHLAPDVTALGDGERADIAARWTEIALMEHASVGAFARFALELLSLGANAELLDATQAAMADEIAHARDAFALASVYAGRDLGPGALDVEAALLGRSPRAVVQTAILEGCIGETIAAIEAAEALAGATDPAVRAALERVVPDETRHAELAWRFVKWALHEAPLELRPFVPADLLALVEGALRDARNSKTVLTTENPALVAHGTLSDARRAEVRWHALEWVIAPCARALVTSVTPRNPTQMHSKFDLS